MEKKKKILPKFCVWFGERERGAIGAYQWGQTTVCAKSEDDALEVFHAQRSDKEVSAYYVAPSGLLSTREQLETLRTRALKVGDIGTARYVASVMLHRVRE